MTSNFWHLLQHNLPSLSGPAHSCIDPQCSVHKDIIDQFCDQLLVVIDLAAHACFPKILPRKVCRVPAFLVGMTKLNLSDKRLSFGTEYGRNVAVHLLEYYHHFRKYYQRGSWPT